MRFLVLALILASMLACMGGCPSGPDPNACTNCGNMAAIREKHHLQAMTPELTANCRREGDKVYWENPKFDFRNPSDHGFWHKVQLYRGTTLLSEWDEHAANRTAPGLDPDDSSPRRVIAGIGVKISASGDVTSASAWITPSVESEKPVEDVLLEIASWK